MMPLPEVARGVVEGILRIFGVVLVVMIGLGHTTAWTGSGWLRSKVVRLSGVLIGLGIVVASDYLGGALRVWLQGGR